MTPTISPIPDTASPSGSQSGIPPFGALEAVLTGAAVVSLDETGWIAVTGEDRVRWLNGMTTNSIQQLKLGDGCYNFILSAQGRIQGDGYAFATSTELLLETDRAQIPRLIELLDRFIIMDDVELRDRSDSQWGLLCAGPTAATMLQAIGIDAADMTPLTRHETNWQGAALNVVCGHAPLVPRFEIWTATAAEREAVKAALMATGAADVGLSVLEQLRILEGTPRYGVDIRDRELPQETGQTRALHFAKGCYLGQEIVERIRSRGNVHRIFHAFRLDGESAQPGAAIAAETKDFGEITSVAHLPLRTGAVQLGLGYIRREALERKLQLEYPGGIATPVDLPFRTPVP